MRKNDISNEALRDAEHYLWAKKEVELAGGALGRVVELAIMVRLLVPAYHAYKTLRGYGPGWGELFAGYEGAWDGLFSSKPCRE